MTETPQGRPGPPGARLGPARLVVLLVVPAAGFILLAATAVPYAPLTGTRQEGATQGAPPRETPSQVVLAPGAGSLQEILAHPDIIPTHHHPLVGRRAPDFELADPEGKLWTLRQLQEDRPLVLIFYYGYHCVGCVRQLKEVNRDLPLFREVGARVVAISADAPELTLERFQQNGPFGFQVLSDPGNKVAQAYGVFKRSPGGSQANVLRHGIFVIDSHGTVQWVNVGDAPFRRNSALLYQLANPAK